MSVSFIENPHMAPKEVLRDYDGLFDNDRFFAVFNKEDVAGLIASLQKCL